MTALSHIARNRRWTKTCASQTPVELNYILIWMVGLSCTVSLLLHGIRFRFRAKGWVLVFVVTLATLACAMVLDSDRAGFIAAAVWGVLYLLPVLGARLLARLIAEQRFGTAQTLSRFLALLHPMDGWRQQPRFLRMLEQIHRGDLADAHAQLTETGDGESSLARFTTLHLFRAAGRWSDLREWVEMRWSDARSIDDANALSLYIRALGELGETESMLAAWGDVRTTPLGIGSRPSILLFVLCLTGKTGLIEQLFTGPLRHHSEPLREFWRATAMQAAGFSVRAEEILGRLASSEDPAARMAAKHRLQRPVPCVAESALSEEARSVLATMESAVGDELRYGIARARGRVPTPVTWILIALNGAAFLLELRTGSEKAETLVRLGALIVPSTLPEAAWWRIFTAGFLHFGPVHLGMNLIGIWILGRYMERVWGRGHLLLCYLAATFGGNALALVFLEATVEAPTIAAGASGGVMGILGASLAFVLIEWHRSHASILRRQLILFGSLFLLQTVFDLATPQVSATIHLSGLLVGLSLGALLAWRQNRGPVAPPIKD